MRANQCLRQLGTGQGLGVRQAERMKGWLSPNGRADCETELGWAWQLTAPATLPTSLARRLEGPSDVWPNSVSPSGRRPVPSLAGRAGGCSGHPSEEAQNKDRSHTLIIPGTISKGHIRFMDSMLRKASS